LIIYMTRDSSEEFAFSTLYEDSQFMEVEAEIPDDEYEKMLAVDKAYWEQQGRLGELYHTPPRRDKR
jgi:hypothetical protein